MLLVSFNNKYRVRYLEVPGATVQPQCVMLHEANELKTIL